MMRDKIFISYSHKDKKWLDVLLKILQPSMRNGDIMVWADTMMGAGQEWRDQIQNALDSAKVAVLLVTPDFLASEFIVNNELPVLLSAAQQNDLAIMWVPIYKALVENTPINKYQAVCNPRKPLGSLRGKSAQYEAFVEISRKIISAATPQKIEVFSASNSKQHFGMLVSKMCDRRIQELAFTRFFNFSRKNHKGFPQFHIVLGEEGDCHSSLVERLTHHTITSAMKEDPENESRGGIRHQPVVDWPKASEGHFEESKLILASELFKAFDPSHYYRGGDLSAGSFGELCTHKLQLHPVIVIEHVVREWSDSTCDLITWYLQFWTEVRERTDKPLFVIFLNVIFPVPARFASKKSIKSVRNRIYQELKKISITSAEELRNLRLDNSCLCFMLGEELAQITREDVLNWMIENKFFDFESDKAKEVEKIFDGAEHKSMIEIEPQLELIRRKYVREKIFL